MLEGRYSWLCEPRMGGGALSLLGSVVPDIDLTGYPVINGISDLTFYFNLE